MYEEATVLLYNFYITKRYSTHDFYIQRFFGILHFPKKLFVLNYITLETDTLYASNADFNVRDHEQAFSINFSEHKAWYYVSGTLGHYKIGKSWISSREFLTLFTVASIGWSSPPLVFPFVLFVSLGLRFMLPQDPSAFHAYASLAN